MTTYSITEADYIAANRRHCGLLFRSRRGWIMPVVAGLLCGFIIAVGLPFDWPQRLAITAGAGLVFAGLVWLSMVMLNWILMPRHARRLYRQTRALQALYTMSWHDRALRFDSERGTQILPWTDFNKWTDGPEGLMLYVSDGMFYLLPVRDIANDVGQSVRAQLNAHRIPEWRAWKKLRPESRRAA